jgi:formylglycine-generating enzyme required for sulfatase activity/tetratricopeptide (TPR) repeat protein
MILPLLRNHGLSLWDDSRIQPDDKWREEIETALAAAKVALLLVSSDFLASEFVTNSELPQLLTAAEEEGLRILWVPVRPSLVRRTPIYAYQGVLDPGRSLAQMNSVEQEEALVEIALAIEKALAPRQDSPPPMRLLRWPSRTQVFYEKLGDTASLTMVRIPAGSFQMGSAEQEPGRHANEGPVHTVALAEFLIGQTPITQAQWRAVARWTPQQGERWGRELNPEPAKFQGEEARLLAGETNTDGRPVERVSWLEAIEFCSRLSQRTGRNYTLPSEAQWEYACRAGTSTAYCFGANIYSDLANFRGTDASRFNLPTPDPQPLFREQTTPAGMFPANAWGLHDMHGNVLEWCLDSVHSSYEGAPCDGSEWEDPQAPKEQQRATRGGSWSTPPKCCRSAFRSPYRSPSKASADGLYIDAGFRVVCLPPGTSLGRVGDSGLTGYGRQPDPIQKALLDLENEESNYGKDHPNMAIHLNNLAGLLEASNQLSEAEVLYRRALAIDEASYGNDNPNVARDLNNLAQLLKATNRLAEAEPLMCRALAIDEASYGNVHPNVARDLNNLAQLLVATARLAEAEPLLRRALHINEASYGQDHPMAVISLKNLAQLLQATNRPAEAESLMLRSMVTKSATELQNHINKPIVEDDKVYPMRTSVFISYSHRDTKWLKKLQTMLAPMVHGGLKIWSDEQIKPGALWRDEIKMALADAKVAVLLVTPNFYASDFITNKELPHLLNAAEEEGLIILWIPIDHSLYEYTAIEKYQAVHPPARPLSALNPAEANAALVAICKAIAEAMAKNQQVAQGAS